MFTTWILSPLQTPDRKTRSRPGSIVISSESTMPLPPKVGSCLMQSTESLKGVGGVPPPPPKPGKLPVKQLSYDGSVHIYIGLWYSLIDKFHFSNWPPGNLDSYQTLGLLPLWSDIRHKYNGITSVPQVWALCHTAPDPDAPLIYITT